MQITSIKVRRVFDEGAMRAIVSVTLDDVLAIHDIKVICARGKYFIVMPSRKMPDDTFRDIVHPISAEFRAQLEEAVLEEYAREAQRIREESSGDEGAAADVSVADSSAQDTDSAVAAGSDEIESAPSKRRSFFGLGF